MFNGGVQTGDLIIRPVGNGYVVAEVKSVGGELMLHVAPKDDSGVGICNLIKLLLVTQRLNR